jgi:hypothetical protein
LNEEEEEDEEDSDDKEIILEDEAENNEEKVEGTNEVSSKLTFNCNLDNLYRILKWKMEMKMKMMSHQTRIFQVLCQYSSLTLPLCV